MAASQGQVQVYELSAWGVWLSSGHLLCHPEHGLSEEAPAVAGTGPVGGSWTVRWDGSHRRAAHPRECLGSDVRNAVGQYWAGWRAGRQPLVFLRGSREGARVTPGLLRLGHWDSAGPGGLASVYLASLCSGIGANGRD